MKNIICLVVLSFFLGQFVCAQSKDNKAFRILTCGIRHESNTFSTLRTGLSDFKVCRGPEVLAERHLWSEYLLNEKDVELIPVLHAYAWPGGIVTQEAYEKFKYEILQAVENAGALDGIYLDMHGALHVDGYSDAQSDLIKSTRALVGDDVVISASFDLHGNPSDEFVKGLDLVTCLRTAPHRDDEETKLRAVKNLLKVLRQGLHPQMAYVMIPVLVPGEKSITEVEPLRPIYASLEDIEQKKGIMDASVFVGYAWADLPRSAMRVFVVAEDSEFVNKAKETALQLANRIWDVRGQMTLDVESGSAEAMIERAKQLPQTTVFISDSGDNTTAGAPGDNSQVIEALLKKKVDKALFAGLVDEEAYHKCLEAGINGKITLELGGKKDTVFGRPLTVEVKVKAMVPNSLLASTQGAVLVESEGVDIVIINSRRSFTTLHDFENIGLDPLDYKIVVVKLGYLYPELRDIAPVHLMALTSGFCNLDMRSLPFKQVNRPIYPLDLDMTWHAVPVIVQKEK